MIKKTNIERTSYNLYYFLKLLLRRFTIEIQPVLNVATTYHLINYTNISFNCLDRMIISDVHMKSNVIYSISLDDLFLHDFELDNKLKQISFTTEFQPTLNVNWSVTFHHSLIKGISWTNPNAYFW